jgi:hypothetical protein
MKIGRLVLVILVLAIITALASNVVHAAGLCVHPEGAGRCFTSIQSAVDAANDGDRITIRPGTYREQITILGKSLTLIGQSGAVIQAPADMEDTLSSIGGVEGRPIILVTGAEVTIRDLTIDGANSAEDNPFLQGITFINAGGVIHHNLIKDVGFGGPRLPINENGEPLYQGEGILVVNFEATSRTVSITENRIINYNNSGITVFAEADPSNPTVANLTAHVVDNTIIGWGPNDVLDQWGIFFGGFNFADPQFSITGTLRGNRIRDQITLAPHPLPGVGIATINTYNVEMANNVIENTNISLAANQAFSARILDNQFVGLQPEVAGSIGLLLSGSDTQVIRNRFKNLELGILLHVEDSNFGSAVNTAMDENRFENVTVDVLTGPGASMTGAARTEHTRPRLRPR